MGSVSRLEVQSCPALVSRTWAVGLHTEYIGTGPPFLVQLTQNHSIFTSQVKRLIPLGCLASESLGNSRIFSREVIFKKKNNKFPVADPRRPPKAQEDVEMPDHWLLVGPPPRIALHLHLS